MSDYQVNENEQTIISILENANCSSEEQALKPDELAARCAQNDLTDENALQAALVNLIDHDIIEYEMNDDLQVTHIWLLQE